MTPAELAAKCVEVLNNPNGLKEVLLVIPGPPPRGKMVRLDRTSRAKCPLGEPVNYSEERGTVAYFDAMEVLAWLAARGMIDVREAPK